MLTKGEGCAFIALHGEQTVSELATNLDTSGAKRTVRLPEWEDLQELAEEYERTHEERFDTDLGPVRDGRWCQPQIQRLTAIPIARSWRFGNARTT